jgi:hypothetical protein
MILNTLEVRHLVDEPATPRVEDLCCKLVIHALLTFAIQLYIRNHVIDFHPSELWKMTPRKRKACLESRTEVNCTSSCFKLRVSLLPAYANLLYSSASTCWRTIVLLFTL